MSYKLNMKFEMYLKTYIKEEQAQALLDECIDEIIDLFINKTEVVGVANDESSVEKVIVDDALWGDDIAHYEPYDTEQ